MTHAGNRDTTVVIIGAGPAGLTLACLLQRSNVDCVVLEARSRAYVERRQRAGMLDHTAGEIFLEHGLADRVLSDARRETHLELRYEGVSRLVDVPGLADGRARWLVPQQVLLQRLIEVFLDGGGTCGSTCPTSSCTTSSARCRRSPIRTKPERAGSCDAGTSRAATVTTASAGPPSHPMRSPRTASSTASAGSRSSPTCPRPDTPCWASAGTGSPPSSPADPQPAASTCSTGPATTRCSGPTSAPGRSSGCGSATPGAKGMNLAIADAHLRAYSDNCLRRTWDCQEFSRWLAETFHLAADHTIDPFRRQLAKARLDRLFTSRTAATAFADLMAGTPTDLAKAG